MEGNGIDVFQIQGHSLNSCMFEQPLKFNFKSQFFNFNLIQILIKFKF